MRILELFSGVGAVSVAAGVQHEVVCAVDISEPAMEVYRANFSSPTRVQEIRSMNFEELASYQADLWWMSPPCQPFTRRGLQQDLNDARTKPLLHLMRAIEVVKPPHVAIENVIGFEDSQACELLMEMLDRVGYQAATSPLCSAQFGLPNLRPRFFVAASRRIRPSIAPPLPCPAKSVAEFLDDGQQLARWGDDLMVERSQLESYRHAINIVELESQMTRCFTSAYGRSLVRSGSYLETEDGFRRFSPTEISRLLGLPGSFRLPESLSTRQLWKLIGNAVSVNCARHVLDGFV